MSLEIANKLETSKLITFFTDGEWDHAIDQLILLKPQMSESSYHFNLGLLYIKKAELPVGKFHLKKAQHLGHKSKDFNLELAKLNSVLKLEKSIPSLEEQGILFAKKYSSDHFIILSLLIFMVLSGLALRLKLKKKMIMAAVLLISLLPYASYKFYFKQLNLGVIIRSTEVREGPSQIFNFTKELKGGTDIVISKTYNNWVFVKGPERFSGWIKRDYVALY